MRTFHEGIQKLVKEKTGILPSVEVPPDFKLGDLALPCFQFAKSMKKSPTDIATELSLLKYPEYIEKVEVKGPYLNFFFNSSILAKQIIEDINDKKKDYGKSPKTSKKVLIEFSAPNTNKPQHLGHMRNNLLGMSVATIKEAAGDKVIKINWINDRGIHICKSMLAYQLFGNNKKPDKKSDHFVGDFYVLFSKESKSNPEMELQAQDLLKLWEEGDHKTRKVWKTMNTWALEGFKETYKRLGIEFDEWYYESDIYKDGKKEVLKGFKKEIFTKDENGAIIAEFESLPQKVLLRADGTSIYATSDIALAIIKAKKKPFESIYVVSSEQELYFKQIFKIFGMMGFNDYEKACRHLSYGMVNLPEGKMKSREGTVVDADDLIEEIVTKAKGEVKKRNSSLSEKEVARRAEAIGLSAIKFFLLKYDRSREFIFHPEESLSFEGETGPYVQYAFARISSILRKENFFHPKPDYSSVDGKELLIHLANYPEIVKESAQKMNPSIIAKYLLTLAQHFNEYYHSTPVLRAEAPVRQARIMLLKSIQQVLENGLSLLGIETLEQM